MHGPVAPGFAALHVRQSVYGPATGPEHVGGGMMLFTHEPGEPHVPPLCRYHEVPPAVVVVVVVVVGAAVVVVPGPTHRTATTAVWYLNVQSTGGCPGHVQPVAHAVVMDHVPVPAPNVQPGHEHVHRQNVQLGPAVVVVVGAAVVVVVVVVVVGYAWHGVSTTDVE